MALRELLLPWDAQPQEAGVALAPRFAAARRGFVFNAGPGSLGDGSIGLSTINSAYTGPRFGPTPDGVGMRLYADNGGNDDDRPQSSFVLPTAKSANLTTVLVFAAINNTYMQGWGPTGHYLRITDPSAYKVQCGYYGDNGFNYIFEDARSDVFDGRAHTLVISTHITAKQISVSWDGNPCTYLSGSLSYIGDGAIPATGQPYLGDRVWTNYYNPNGHLLLWAYLPDVFLAQGEAHELARNPWSLFEPRRIHVPVSAGGGNVTVNLSGISASFAQTAPAVSSTVSLVGENAAAGAGTLLPAFSFSLLGQAGAASAGTLSPSTSRGLSGQSAAFAAGSVIPSVAIAAIGLQATFASGTLTASSSSGTTVNLVGEPVAFAQTAPSVNVTIALTGIAAIMASGLLSASSGTAIITVKAGSWLRYKKLQ